MIIVLSNSTIAQADSNPADNYKPLAAYKADSLWHFVDYKGKELFSAIKLHNVMGYSDGMFCVSIMTEKTEKWGYLDTTGKFVIEPVYDKAMLFTEGYAVVFKFAQKLGGNVEIDIINKEGKRLNKTDLIEALSFSEGLAFVTTIDRKSGYINYSGDFMFSIDPLVGGRFNEGLSQVTNNDMNAGFINNKGEIVIPVRYESAKNFSEGLAPVSKNSKYSYINRKGETKINGNFDFARDFKEGRAFVGELFPKSFITLWGLIDTTGEIIKDFRFSSVWDFSEGYAAVCDSVLWGFVDEQGNYVIEPSYSYTASFVDGIAWASKKSEGNFGFINKNEEYILKFNNFEKLIDLRLNKRMY